MMKPSDLSYKLTKVLAHLMCWLPLLYVVFSILTQNRALGADPQEAVLHLMGLWSLIFLLITLSLTPLNKIFHKAILIRFRRAFGLYAFFYLFLHITTFFIFYLELDISQLIHETVKRPYITLGMVGFLLMSALTVTSTKTMQRKLGYRWKKLHKSIYIIGLLAVVHFLWQSKSDINEPLWYILWLTLVLGYRFYDKRTKYQSRI